MPTGRSHRTLTPHGLRLLRGYRRNWSRPDALAGVTVAAYLIPQVMAYADFQQLAELGELVLGLRGGEPVARHDDDLAGVGELDRHVIGAHRADDEVKDIITVGEFYELAEGGQIIFT